MSNSSFKPMVVKRKTEYAYTSSEMLQIVFAISKTPINKAQVMKLLEKGKGGNHE